MQAFDTRLDIDKEDVLSRLGYRPESPPPERIASLVDDYIGSYHELLAPSYSCVIRGIVSVKGGRVTIENAVTFESLVIARLAQKGLVLEATVLDAIGSGAAERLADYVEDGIRRQARADGLVTSRRFSPGYCDWDAGQQKTVFQALNGDTAGIRLTESFLMVPRKSVSGIAGIGAAEKVVASYKPCPACRKPDCPGRRAV